MHLPSSARLLWFVELFYFLSYLCNTWLSGVPCRLLRPGGQLCLVGLTYGDSAMSKLATGTPAVDYHRRLLCVMHDCFSNSWLFKQKCRIACRSSCYLLLGASALNAKGSAVEH